MLRVASGAEVTVGGSAEWGAVQVRWSRTADVAGRAVERVGMLGDGQVARLRALDGARARRFAAGRALLVAALDDLLGAGADLTVTTACERCGGDHGPVRHPRAAISISYAGELVVVAVAPAGNSGDAAAAVGVDIERDDPVTRRRIAEAAALLPAGAPPTLAHWTRVEAVLKADGRGMRVSPEAVTFSPDLSSARVPGRRAPIDVATLVGPRGFALSAAVVPPAAAEW